MAGAMLELHWAFAGHLAQHVGIGTIRNDFQAAMKGLRLDNETWVIVTSSARRRVINKAALRPGGRRCMMRSMEFGRDSAIMFCLQSSHEMLIAQRGSNVMLVARFFQSP